MIDFNQTRIGSVLVVLSLALIVILVFVKVNSDKEGAFLCKVVAENPDLSMDQCPAHDSATSWLLTVAFGVAAIMLLAGGLLLMRFRVPGQQESQFQESPHPGSRNMKNLDEHEKKVIELLQQNEGSMYQSDIIKDTSFSKVQMTRILDKLEGKQFIERKRRGMTNIIILR